jgi:hypothetical protein
MASLYVARGGRMRDPVTLAMKLSANGKINRLVTQTLSLERKAKKTIRKTRAAREASFLTTLLLRENG